MKTSLTYSVQIIIEQEQLAEAFNLRYRTYKKVYPRLTANCMRPYETDVFDSRSIHLGLYVEDEKGKKLAGYCRLILPHYFKDSYSEYLIQNHSLYSSKKSDLESERMGFFQYMPDSYLPIFNSFCQDLENKGQVYAETSRFIIAEEHRSLSLSAFFAKGMFAIATALKMTYNFFSCQDHHAAFYKKIGLTVFSKVEPFFNKSFDRMNLIFGTDLTAANTQQSGVFKLKRQLEVEDRITFRRVA